MSFTLCLFCKYFVNDITNKKLNAMFSLIIQVPVLIHTFGTNETKFYNNDIQNAELFASLKNNLTGEP